MISFLIRTEAQWIKLTKPNNNNFTHVCFPDAENGWIGQPNFQKPLNTTNSGQVWQSVGNSDDFDRSEYVYFPTKEEGYINGEPTLAKETFDGGKTWKKFGTTIGFTGNSGGMRGMKKFPEGYYLANYGNLIMKISTNKKITLTGTFSSFSKIYFCDSLIFYAMNGTNSIKKTTDGGVSWNNLGIGFNTAISDLWFTDPLHGIAIGINATILYTNNGGVSWKVISNRIGGFDYKAVTFTTPSTGYICGDQGSILKTTDGGLSWKEMKSGTFENLNAMSFPDSTIGYCVGENGTILKLIEDNSVPQVTSIIPPTGVLCTGAFYKLSYTVNKKFGAGNIFTAQLSDGVGDFSKNTLIGTNTSDTSGTMAIQIPAIATRNFGYRLRLQSSNPVGTSATNDRFIEIRPSVVPTIAIVAAKTKLCSGQEAFLTSKTANAGTTPQVLWYMSNELVATQPSYKLAPKDKTQIIAKIKSKEVCAAPDSAVSNTIVFDVTTPTIATITASGNTLTSSAMAGNQWFKDDAPILTAKDRTYTASATGMYKVQVSDGICPTVFSDAISIIISGNELNSETSGSLVLYPNPATSTISIVTSIDIQKIVVYSSNGLKVIESQYTKELDISALPAGLYLLEVWNKSRSRIVKKFEKREE